MKFVETNHWIKANHTLIKLLGKIIFLLQVFVNNFVKKKIEKIQNYVKLCELGNWLKLAREFSITVDFNARSAPNYRRWISTVFNFEIFSDRKHMKNYQNKLLAHCCCSTCSFLGTKCFIVHDNVFSGEKVFSLLQLLRASVFYLNGVNPRAQEAKITKKRKIGKP